MKDFCILVCILLLHFKVLAVDKNWTGATNLDWNTASNWSPAGVPGPTDNVFIHNTANAPRILSGVNANVNDFAMANGSSLTIEASGSLVIRRNTANPATQSPLTNATLTNYGTFVMEKPQLPSEGMRNGFFLAGSTAVHNHGTMSITVPGDAIIYYMLNTARFTNYGTASLTLSSDRDLITYDPGQFINHGLVMSSGTYGAYFTSGTFTNDGMIFMSGGFVIGGNATNLVCGKIVAASMQVTSGSFSNAGLVYVHGGMNAQLTRFTNDGVVKYGTLTQPFTNNHIAITDNADPIFTFGSGVTETIEGIFLDEEGTVPAGTYVQATNKFTPNGDLAPGPRTLYVKVSPAGASCAFTVPFVHTITASAPCPSGNVVLASQNDVSAFVSAYPGCTAIAGGLTIGDPAEPMASDITSLQGLAGITSINGKLTITNNRDLVTLAGLGNLTKLGSLDISYNDVLASINPLAGMSPVDSSTFDLTISDNALTTLKGLEGISVARSVTIHNSDVLTNLDGLSNLTYVSQVLSLFGNGITRLQGLEKLTRVGDLGISTNRSLTDLTGLSNLTTIDGTAMFQDNDALVNLIGLENLQNAGMIGFGMHNSLTSLEGIDNLQGTTTFLLIENPLLTSCAVKPLCEAIATSGSTMSIQNNGTGCNSLDQISEACAALPVTLVDFTVAAEGGAAYLAWTTAGEVNSDHFEVQTSTDAVNWNTLGTVLSNGDSKETHQYAFTHRNPSQPIHYYRLKMVDRDGTFAFSRIRSIAFNAPRVTVHPNPAADVVYLEGEDLEKLRCVELTDKNGRTISELREELARGIPLNGIPAGLYFLRVHRKDGSWSAYRVVKM